MEWAAAAMSDIGPDEVLVVLRFTVKAYAEV